MSHSGVTPRSRLPLRSRLGPRTNRREAIRPRNRRLHPASQRFEALDHAATDPKGIGRAPQPATLHYPFHTQVGVTLTDMIFAPRACLRHCALDMLSLLLELRKIRNSHLVPPPAQMSSLLLRIVTC